MGQSKGREDGYQKEMLERVEMDEFVTPPASEKGIRIREGARKDKYIKFFDSKLLLLLIEKVETGERGLKVDTSPG